MRRTHERVTKARLIFSGGPLAPVNMVGSMEEAMSVIIKKKMASLLSVLISISYAKFSQILEVLRDFHHLFGSRNSPTTGILHSLRHIYKSEKISLALVQRSNDLRMTFLAS